jgi:hypothetical protein
VVAELKRPWEDFGGDRCLVDRMSTSSKEDEVAEETRPTEEPDVEAHGIGPSPEGTGVSPEGTGPSPERSSEDDPDFELHGLGVSPEGAGVSPEGTGVSPE